MKNIHIKTSVLFLVILDGLPTDWLVFNVFKFFKSFHLIYIIIIIIIIIKTKKQKTKAKRKQN